MLLIILRNVRGVHNWTRYSKYAAVIALAILIGVVGALVFRHIAPNFRAEEVKKPVELLKKQTNPRLFRNRSPRQ